MQVYALQSGDKKWFKDHLTDCTSSEFTLTIIETPNWDLLKQNIIFTKQDESYSITQYTLLSTELQDKRIYLVDSFPKAIEWIETNTQIDSSLLEEKTTFLVIEKKSSFENYDVFARCYEFSDGDAHTSLFVNSPNYESLPLININPKVHYLNGLQEYVYRRDYDTWCNLSEYESEKETNLFLVSSLFDGFNTTHTKSITKSPEWNSEMMTKAVYWNLMRKPMVISELD